MPPKGTAAVKAKVTRLPPLPHLRVKTPNIANARPCNTVMASVLSMSTYLRPIWPLSENTRCTESQGRLGRAPAVKRAKANDKIDCWASSGYSVEGCASLETALRTCMDAPVCTSIMNLEEEFGIEMIKTNAINRDRRTSKRTPSTTTCRECIHRWLDRTRESRSSSAARPRRHEH